MYIVLDHTRTVMMTVQDGQLPSNVGGGSNVRNILRRVFAIFTKNDWWDKLEGLKGLFELFDCHKTDLEGIFGAFKEYSSFNDIIKMEHERWLNTDSKQKNLLKNLLKKNKGKLSIDDWILAMQTWGIPADSVSQISKLPIPNNLYYEIAERLEKITKAAPVILYDTFHLPETENLYYKDHKLYTFESEIVDVFQNVQTPDQG